MGFNTNFPAFVPKTEIAVKKATLRLPAGLKKALVEVWKVIKEFGSTIGNPIDPDWRKNQKYGHILEGIYQGFAANLDNPHGGLQFSETGVHEVLTQWTDEIGALRGALPPRPTGKGSQEACIYSIKRALQCLIDPKVPFRNKRDRYKACLTACEKALATDYYQKLIKKGGVDAHEMREIEENHAEVAVLHAFALAMFTSVNTQGFTESLAEEMAKEGGYKNPLETDKRELLDLFKASTAQIPAFNTSVAKASSLNKIALHTQLGVQLSASNRFTPFYPIKTGGNPVNVKYSLRVGERVVTCIRSPTVTVGMNKVSPLFKAYLRALKSRGLKHTYINLQDRRSLSQLPGMRRVANILGFIREDLRCKTIEKLNRDPEFKGVLSVYTLDKDSSFYQQRVDPKAAKQLLKILGGILDKKQIAGFQKRLRDLEKEAEAMEELLELYQKNKAQLAPLPPEILINKKSFIEEFKWRLWQSRGSFYLPREHRKEIEAILEDVGEGCFSEKKVLTPLERQDLIEVAYEFITDYLIYASEACYFFEACKENADRGGGTNCQKLSTKLLVEILTHPERQNLKQDVLKLVSRIDEDTLWARKRGVNERLGRTVQALKRLGNFAEAEPDRFLDLVRKANGSTDLQVVSESKPEQRVKNFRKDYKMAKEAQEMVREVRLSKKLLRGLFSKAA